VRYYQRRGLLAEPASDAGGYRRYDSHHLERLHFIKRAQGVGFTLEEIGDLMTLNDTRDHRLARQLAGEKIRNIEARIGSCKVADALRQLVHRCECGGQDMPCPIIRMALTPYESAVPGDTAAHNSRTAQTHPARGRRRGWRRCQP
jgi:MerR family mercuric resistance operon transcriptional regulator